MSRNRKLLVVALIGLLVLGVFAMFVIPTSTSVTFGSTTVTDDGGFKDFVPFMPIWIAIFVPLLIRKQREEDEKRKRQQVTRKFQGANRLEMMQNLVDDLDDDELNYLENKLYQVHGNVLDEE